MHRGHAGGTPWSTVGVLQKYVCFSPFHMHPFSGFIYPPPIFAMPPASRAAGHMPAPWPRWPRARPSGHRPSGINQLWRRARGRPVRILSLRGRRLRSEPPRSRPSTRGSTTPPDLLRGDKRTTSQIYAFPHDRPKVRESIILAGRGTCLWVPNRLMSRQLSSPCESA
jgi:hypothetical protein